MPPRLALLPLLLLGACAVQNCDPATAGFFGGIGCEVSGSYNQREGEQQRALEAARRDLGVQRAAADAAARDRAAAEANLAGMQAELRAMGQQDVALRRRIDAARQRQGADAAAIQRAQTQLDALEQQRARITAAPSSAAVQDLDRRRRALLEAITDSGI